MRASLSLHGIAVAALALSALSACAQPAEQQAMPYALRAGVESYYYPFRAKVEDSGHQAIGTGYVGCDEQGRVFISFFWRGSSSATDVGLQSKNDLRGERWQIEEERGFLILESRLGDGPMRSSSLIPMDFKPTEFWNEDDMPQMVILSARNNPALEPNGTEWRREFHSEDREEGQFFANGIQLQGPFWQVHERWTRESMEAVKDPEIEQPRQPPEPQK